MNTKTPCLFCDIIAGKIPAYTIYEDDNVIVFLDIAPVTIGHSLVVPKAHCKDISTFPLEYSTAVFNAMQIASTAIIHSSNAVGYNILQNNGSEAGQIIFHIHWHIIPRYTDDGFLHWKGKTSQRDALQDTAIKIRNHIE